MGRGGRGGGTARLLLTHLLAVVGEWAVTVGALVLATRVDELAARHGATHADTDGTWAVHTGYLAHQAGRLGTLVPMMTSMLELPTARTWQAALALAHLAAGDEEAAAAQLAAQGDVPRNDFWLTVMQVQAEVAAALGLTARCQELHDQLAPYRGRLGITASGSLCWGLVSRTVGTLALALGRDDEAVELLAEAVADADTSGLPFEGTVARRQLAAALLATGAVDQAAAAIDAALATARARGYAGDERLITDLLRPQLAAG